MKRLFLIFLFWIWPLTLPATRFALWLKEPQLQEKVLKCYHQIGKAQNYPYQPQDFALKKMWQASRKARKIAIENSLKRVRYIQCIHPLINQDSKQAFEYSLDRYYKEFWTAMGLYNRWLYSLESQVLMRPFDKAEISRFSQTKYSLYKLLENRTREWLQNSNLTNKQKEMHQDFKNIYLSLYKLHYEFYYNLNPELRKKILSNH